MRKEKDRVNDKFSAYRQEVAHLRPIGTTVPEFAWHIISGFHPQLPPRQWRAVREFVIIVVLEMAPHTYENARRLMTMVSRYVTWVWVATGRELAVKAVFTDDLIKRFIAESLSERSPAYRHGVVRQLNLIAAELGRTEMGRTRIAHSRVRAPLHTRAELATMFSWASTLSTEFKRQNAWAILGLSGGAGLSSAEASEVRVEDIQTIDQYMFVAVRGLRPRTVPVMAAWVPCITRSIGTRRTGYLIRGYRFGQYPPRVIQSFLTKYRGEVRPSPRRLAFGWVVAQINADLPLPVLLSITGLNSPGSLEPYLRHARQKDAADYYPLIVGAEVN